MKKSIIAIMTGLALCSCTLEKASTSGNTFDNLKTYTQSTFVNNVVYPAGVMNRLVSLDQYISASEEERKGEEFRWHRENIFHEDDVTFMVSDLGTVRTYGKSLFDPDSDWKMDNGLKITRTGEQTWKLEREDNYSYAYNSTITWKGRNAVGKNIFDVEVYNTDESRISSYSETTVKAIITTPEGPMTVIDPEPDHYEYYGFRNAFPEGEGVFRIDMELHGEPLDWTELRYNVNGKELVFNSSRFI